MHRKNNNKNLIKVVPMKTDNEATVKLACSNLSVNCKRLSCLAHNLNLVVHNSFQLWTKPLEYETLL